MANDDEVRLYLIKPPLSAERFRQQFWGNLILKPTRPDFEFSSYKKRTPLEILPSIEEWSSIRMANYSEVLQWSKYVKGDAAVHSVLSAFYASGTSEEAIRQATEAELHHMTAPRRQFEELLENEEWAKDALDFVHRHNGVDLYFATDILVLTNLSMNRNSGHNRGGGAKVTVPDPDGTGKLGSAGISGGKERGREVEADFADPLIIAIGYYPVTVEKMVDSKLPGTTKQGSKSGFGRKIVDKIKSRDSSASRDPSPKPVSRPAGELYHEETRTTYRLSLVPYMAAGPVTYMERSDPAEVETGEETATTGRMSIGSVVIVVEEPADGRKEDGPEGAKMQC